MMHYGTMAGLGSGSLSGNSLGIAGLGATSTWIGWYNQASAEQQEEFDTAAEVIDAGGAVPDDVSDAVHDALVIYKAAGGRDDLVPASHDFTVAQITAAQQFVNTALSKAGYQQIGVDGKLGPATCGAIIWYQKHVDSTSGLAFMAECATREMTNPPRPPTKLSLDERAGADAGAESPTKPRDPEQAHMLLYGGALAALIVGGALMYRASKKR